MTNLVGRIDRALAGRYRVQREKGRNRFTVWLAHDIRHNREVELWVTHAEELAASIRVERFLGEVSLIARLDHPHILPVLDFGQVGEFTYCVTASKGESLRDRMDRDKKMRIGDALEITRQVAGALSYAHERGVVHHDVKPAKIQIEAGHALLSGWISRALMVTNLEKESGLAIGTPLYVSPEQAAGRDVDHRSDVYSLACVLYEMLTGEPPFMAPTAQALFAKHSAQIPTPIRRLRRKVPVVVEAALATALAKRPSDRFSTMLQFVEALKPRRQWLGRWLTSA